MGSSDPTCASPGESVAREAAPSAAYVIAQALNAMAAVVKVRVLIISLR